jgi:hypothetical protein
MHQNSEIARILAQVLAIKAVTYASSPPIEYSALKNSTFEL